MKFKKLILLPVLFVFLNGFSQGVKFEKKAWKDILAMSKANKKPIFLDIYATWCGPCKMLDNEVYPEKQVGAFMNKNFINVKIDGEKGEGIKLAEEFNVDSYPTILFINENGGQFHRYSGFYPADEFIAEAESALKKVNEPSFASLEKEYTNGNRKPDFLKNYLERIKTDKPESIEHGAILDEYLKAKQGPISDDDLNLIWANMASINYDSKAYSIAKSNIDRVFKLTNQDKGTEARLLPRIDTFIGFYNMERAFFSQNEAGLKTAITVFLEKTKACKDWFTFPEKSVFTIESDFYRKGKNLPKYFEVSKKFLDKAYPAGKTGEMLIGMYPDIYNSKIKTNDGEEPSEMLKQQAKMSFFEEIAMDLNNVAWAYYEEKAPDLNGALKWSKQCLALSESAAYLDTYAHLLYKTGNKKEAIIQQEKAIKLATTNEENTDELEKELELMKSGTL